MSSYHEANYATQFSEFAGKSNKTIHRSQALALFNQARQAAFMEKLKSILLRSKRDLLDLDTVPMKNVRAQHYGGIKAVTLDQICGSNGRVSDFDHSMNPLSDRTRDRWINIAVVRFENKPLPAVELIQVGSCYYIKDGHHRISVARTLGEYAIDAEVTVWELNDGYCTQNQCVAQNGPLAA
jgi:hypothetical protein